MASQEYEAPQVIVIGSVTDLTLPDASLEDASQ